MMKQRKKGLIASSAGNHAQGVAYAAKKLGVKATICMPAHTPLIKVDATKHMERMLYYMVKLMMKLMKKL